MSQGTNAAQRRTLIVSGTGRYADTWHSYAETSARLAAILEGEGHLVHTRGDVDLALAELDHWP